MWLFYQAVYGLVLLVAGPFLLAARGRHYLPTLPGRLTLDSLPEPPREGRPLWLHAVSVGEVAVAAALAAALPDDLPLLVTTVTPTGQARAQKLFAGRAAVAYLPFDLGWTVTRFFDRFSPRALVLVEGDYWPRVLSEARRRGLPVAVVNGRMGDRSSARLRLLASLARRLFAAVDRFGVQSGQDRDRLTALGVPEEKITVTGNLKYEAPEPARHPELEERLKRLAGGRPLVVAGSTMAGEESEVLAAFRQIGGGERALLALAPRHPERFDEVARLLEREGLATIRRSSFGEEPAETGSGERPDVVLLDTLGELAGLYALADISFIGGTLVPTGGHNPLEPARYGVPVTVGPSMDNFRDMAAQFERARAWRQVENARGLAGAWDQLLNDPDAARSLGERARALVEENRGAVGRTLEVLREVLG